QHQPEQGRGHAPGALALPLLQQLAEDRDKGGRQGGVGDERADEIRDLERDGEGVDLPGGSEVVRRLPLAHEAEDARQSGGEAEDESRDGEAPALGRRLPRRRARVDRLERRRRLAGHRPTRYSGTLTAPA